MNRIALSALLFVALYAAPSWAQGGECEVRRIRGESLRGDLKAISAGSMRIQPQGAEAVAVPIGECVSLQFKRAESRADNERREPLFVNIQLADGGTLAGLVAGGDGEKLQLGMSGSIIAIPLDGIRKLTFPVRVPPQVLDFAANPGGDRVYVLHKNNESGDATVEPVNGTISKFGEKSLEIEGVLGKTVYEYEKVAAVLLTPLSGKPGAKDAKFEHDATVTLVPDGSVKVKIHELNNGVLSCECESLGKFQLSAKSIQSIRFRNSNFTDLSELDPVEVVEAAWFGGANSVRFPWKRNRTVTGGPLRVGGVFYESGLGVHSRSVMTWNLGGAYTGFRTRAGVDDETLKLSRKGSVIFRISADGKKLYESGIVRSGERALEIPELDVKGAAKLTLEVDFADGFDIADRADWCDSILLKTADAAPPEKK